MIFGHLNPQEALLDAHFVAPFYNQQKERVLQEKCSACLLCMSLAPELASDVGERPRVLTESRPLFGVREIFVHVPTSHLFLVLI